jgi:hypothetical protein
MDVLGLKVVIASGVIALTVSGVVAPQDWPAADKATVRLKPAAFPDLPDAVRRYLEQRGCEVPQAFSEKPPHNVVRGRFTSAARTDIAVLCSTNHSSSVLVFRGGTTSSVAVLAKHPDEDFLQVVDADGAVGYSRALGIASPDYIRKHHAAYGGRKPPPLNHDGIDDIFVEKGSVVWYWYGGRWLQLQGAD